MSEILTHPWMQGDTATFEEVKQEFDQRLEFVKQTIEAEKAQKEVERKARQAIDLNKLAKVGHPEVRDGTEIDVDTLKPLKPLEEYEHIFQHGT